MKTSIILLLLMIIIEAKPRKFDEDKMQEELIKSKGLVDECKTGQTISYYYVWKTDSLSGITDKRNYKTYKIGFTSNKDFRVRYSKSLSKLRRLCQFNRKTKRNIGSVGIHETDEMCLSSNFRWVGGIACSTINENQMRVRHKKDPVTCNLNGVQVTRDNCLTSEYCMDEAFNLIINDDSGRIKFMKNTISISSDDQKAADEQWNENVGTLIPWLDSGGREFFHYKIDYINEDDMNIKLMNDLYEGLSKSYMCTKCKSLDVCDVNLDNFQLLRSKAIVNEIKELGLEPGKFRNDLSDDDLELITEDDVDDAEKMIMSAKIWFIRVKDMLSRFNDVDG
jgi:hypothetical protein